MNTATFKYTQHISIAICLFLYAIRPIMSSPSKYISLPLYSNRFIYYYINDSVSYINLTVGLQSTYSFTNTKHFAESALESFSKATKEYIYREGVFAFHSSHNITTPLHFKQSEQDYFAAFGRVLAQQNYSIINYLCSNNYIDYKSFALAINQNESNSIMYIGKTPSRIIKGKYKTEIQPMQSIAGWSFKLHSLVVNGKRLLTKDIKVRLALDHDTTIVNKEIYEWIRENVFKQYLDGVACRENIRSGYKMASLWCNNTVIPKLPKVYIEVNDGKKRLHLPIHFRQDNALLNIAYNSVVDKDNVIWLLRSVFYDKVIEFDYQRDKIVFHMNEDENWNKAYQIGICVALGYLQVIALAGMLWGTKSFWGRKRNEKVNIDI